MNPAYEAEHRHGHGWEVSTVVCENGSLACATHLDLLAAMTRTRLGV